MKFTKMQGIGNDYLYVNTFEECVDDPPALAVRLSDRHFGVGADGLVLIGPSETMDFRMRIFNADGSESEMCGNACRCVGKYVYERGLTDRTELRLETGAGERGLRMEARDGHVTRMQVDMGLPCFDAEAIPVRFPGGGSEGTLEAGGRVFEAHCVSMGNPHCVIFTEDPDAVPLECLGPLLERHPAFPRRANIEFAKPVDRGHLRMRVWERGSGETLACGTGACAVFAAALRAGLCGEEAVIDLRGGSLLLRRDPLTGRIWQEGPAEFVFDGTVPC